MEGLEHLESGPDLDKIDFSKLDMGNDLPEDEPKVDETPAEDELKAEETPAEDEQKADEKVDETQAEDESKGEQKADEKPRDESGKFAKKDKPIPVERHKAILDKERDAREQAEKKAAELERQLAEREQTAKQTVQRSEIVEKLDAQITDLEKQHSKLLLDGDAEKAAEMMADIRKLNRQVARIEAQDESQQIVSHTLEQERLVVAIAKLEADHPTLNPRSEVYDDDLVQMILLMQGTLIQKGSPPSKALVDATEKVMKKMEAAKPAEDDAEDAEEVKAGLAEASKKAEDRKKQAVDKSLDTQKKQPAQTQSLGLDSDKAGEKALPDVSKMSSEEFAALPEATRARLRGDMG